MAVRNGSNVIETETDDIDLAIGSATDGRIDEDWYYVGSADNYSRRIESESPAGGRVNHIVLWNCGGEAADSGARHDAHRSLIGCELSSHPAAGVVRVTYGVGAEPATITIGTASIVFDPHTIADVILWNAGARVGAPRPELFTWDTSARSGAGAFVFAGYAS